MFVWLNGRLIDQHSAQISLNDRGFLLGDGAFETLRYEGGQLVRWDAHSQRLRDGLHWLGIDYPDLETLPAQIHHLVSRNRLDRAVVRLTVTRGASGPGLDPDPQIAPTVAITARALPERRPMLDLTIFEEPVRSGLPQERFKLTQYGPMQRARNSAREVGADMSVVLNSVDRSLACCDSANLFWIEGEHVFTPGLDTGALPGTVRAALMALAETDGIDVSEVRAPANHLQHVDAVFVTNAVKGLVPVRSVDQTQYQPDNAIFERLLALFAD